MTAIATQTAPTIGLSRWQAAAIHLLISAVIAAVALFVLMRIWYPPPFFIAEGGSELLFLLIAVETLQHWRKRTSASQGVRRPA